MKPFNRLMKLLNLDKKEISQIYIYAIFIGLLNLTLPLGVQLIINFIQAGQVSTSWVLLVLLVVLGVLLAGILQVFQLRITENIQQKLFIRSSFEFAFRIPRFNIFSIKSYYPPELVNRFFDTMTLQKGLPKLLIDFSSATLQLLFGLILLSIYHPFFIIFSFLLVIILFFSLYITGKKGLETSLNESKNKYKVASWLEEIARTMNTFKLAGNSQLPLKKTDKLVDAYIKEREAHFKVLYNQFFQLVGFKVLTAFVLLFVGGLLVINQQINIGQFVAAEIIILLVINSIEKIILNIENLYDVLTAVDKLGYVTDIPIEEEGGEGVCNASSDALKVSFNNVTFKFDISSAPIFENLNITIESGEHTAILGDDGAGKTTFLHLIGNLFPTTSGAIVFNEIPASNINLEDLRANIGDYVSDQQLFLGSVEDNIAMERPNITMQDLIWACEQVGLLSFIQGLKNGFKTQVDPNGNYFSRSIKQKIILARCIITKPKLLLMDDQQRFTSSSLKSVDHLSEMLFDEKASWTLIAATKNENWLHLFKKIIFIEKGNIIFEGNYNEYQLFKKK